LDPRGYPSSYMGKNDMILLQMATQYEKLNLKGNKEATVAARISGLNYFDSFLLSKSLPKGLDLSEEQYLVKICNKLFGYG
jgi:hypothetical protein